MDKFDNQERRRYYGLRVGDTVELKYGPVKGMKAEVTAYCFGDNNRVYVRMEDGTKTDWVAEWCEIITKIEDK
jgi:hypothetical protein